ncbi:MAG TPA: hypothetical protein VJZ27_06630 [Aggregatilineales bacterium]|nr:hypothetical protein [Aggregatilineales bacterium]
MNQDNLHFIQAFEAGTLTDFHHRDHIRMAWIYLRRDGESAGIKNIRSGIQGFALKHGATTLYHETITLFWTKVVMHAISVAPEIEDFEAFAAEFPFLVDKTSIKQHYSDSVLGSDMARGEWVSPDLHPMP